jgi:hypothetical protein
VPEGAQVELSVGDVVAVEVLGPGPTGELVWELGNADLPVDLSAPWPKSYSVREGEVPVDLEFLRDLPAGAVTQLALADNIVAASFPAISHLGPGLLHLRLVLSGLDDGMLALVSGLRALESLQIYGGAFTEQGLQQISGLPRLNRLHVEMEGLRPSAFTFAAEMPNLVQLSGPDETPDQPWTATDVNQLR